LIFSFLQIIKNCFCAGAQFSNLHDTTCGSVNIHAFLLFFVNIAQFESQNIVYYFKK